MEPHGAVPSSATDKPQKSSPMLWIALAACLAIIIGLGVILLVTNDDSGTTAGGTTSESTTGGGETTGGEEEVPGEYLLALEQAEFLANDMHQSRNRVHDSLTSPYGEDFTEEEAQYAVDNL